MPAFTNESRLQAQYLKAVSALARAKRACARSGSALRDAALSLLVRIHAHRDEIVVVATSIAIYTVALLGLFLTMVPWPK